MKPKFLFTLGGDMGTQVISEPEGWATIIFNLERDLTYWSLIENFELPLIFYGKAEGKDGGYSYLSAAIINGVDTLVTIDIQVSFNDGDSYDICFDGRIDLSTAQETIYRSKISAAIVRNDIWAMFMANKSKPVDLFSTIDLYGNHRYSIAKRELALSSQKIQQKYTSFQGTADVLYPNNIHFQSAGWTINNYIQFDVTTTLLDEIKTAWDIPFSWNIPSIGEAKFTMEFAGSYSFDFKIEGSAREDDAVVITKSDYGSGYVKWYFQKNSETPIAFSESNVGTGAGVTANKSTVYTFVSTIDILAGDDIRIFGQITASMAALGPNPYYWIWGFNTSTTPSGAGSVAGIYPTYFNVTGNTIYQDTACDTILVHDAGLSICDRMIGRDDSFYSAFFGGLRTTISYGANGCGYLNALTRGVNLRGYNFSEKPFTLSFDDWWNGVNPIFNLGLGYEELTVNSPGSTVIRVENKGYFFNSTPLVFLTGLNDIQTQFDLNLFTKTIQIGFETWAAESASGIDDPQTNHIYNVRFQLFGKDEKQMSKFVGASIPIEQGRRLTKTQSQDWRLDENTFIIALKEQDAIGSSPTYPTEFPELFNSGVSGINNSSTRYNVRHTPARMLQRWLNFYSGQLQSYLADSFKFGSGEGNILMTWSGDGSCDIGTLTENQNISISGTFLFLPIVYTFTHPLTWDEYTTIRDNRKNGISISWIFLGVTYTKIAYIKKLGYDINKSKGTFEVWITIPVITPPDGILWIAKSCPSSQWFHVAFGNGIFIATNEVDCMKSIDGGQTWGTVSIGAQTEGIAYGAGLFVIVISSGGTSAVRTSPDGLTWTTRTTPNSAWYAVCFANNQFVAVSFNAALAMTSPDGITWTQRTASSNSSWVSITYGNGLYVAVGQSGVKRAMTSPDGITWTDRTASDITKAWFKVVFGNNIFVALNVDGTLSSIMTSPDGITWTNRNAAQAYAWRGLAFGGNIFVAASATGTGNRIMTSPDGITWTSRTSTSDDTWMDIAFGLNTFVVVGQTNTVMLNTV